MVISRKHLRATVRPQQFHPLPRSRNLCRNGKIVIGHAEHICQSSGLTGGSDFCVFIAEEATEGRQQMSTAAHIVPQGFDQGILCAVQPRRYHQFIAGKIPGAVVEDIHGDIQPEKAVVEPA